MDVASFSYSAKTLSEGLNDLDPVLLTRDYLCAREIMQNTYARDVLIRYLEQQKYRYFWTLTFNSVAKENESDENLLRILKMATKKLFGTHYIKRNKFLKLSVVREMDRHQVKSHYHILVEHHPDISLESLVKTIIYVSNHSKCMANLSEKFFDRIIAKRHMSDQQFSDDPHINIVEIETAQDLYRISKYLCKYVFNSPKSWDFSSTSETGYLPIHTKW